MRVYILFLWLGCCSLGYSQGGDFNVVVENGSGVRVSGMGYWLTIAGRGNAPVNTWNTGNNSSVSSGNTVTNIFSLGGGANYRGGMQALFVIWSSGSSSSPDLWSGWVTLEPETIIISLSGSPSLGTSVGINGGSNNVCQSVVNSSGSGAYYGLISSASGAAVSLDGCGHNWSFVPPGGSAQLCGVVGSGDSLSLTSLASSTQILDVTSGVIMAGGGDSGCLAGGVTLTNYGYNVLGAPVSATNGIASVPQASGTNGITYPGTTNGPSGGLALNSDMDTGFAALHADLAGVNGSIIVGTAALGNDLLALRTNSEGGYGTNIINVSNNWPSNYPDAAVIAALSLSNQLSNGLSVKGGLVGTASNGLASLTNAGDNLGAGLASNVLALAGNAETGIRDIASGFQVGSGISNNIGLPPTSSGLMLGISIGWDTLPVVAKDLLSAIKTLAVWFVVLTTLFLMLHDAEVAIDRVMNQRQAQGSEQEAIGWNASLETGYVYAGIIVAVVATIPVVVAAIVGGYAVTAGGGGAEAVSVVTNNAVWDIVFHVVPVYVMVTAIADWFLFHYVLMAPACLLARVMVVFLVS